MKMFIKQITATIEKAREMERKGNVLEFISMHLDGTATYNVFQKSSDHQYEEIIMWLGL